MNQITPAKQLENVLTSEKMLNKLKSVLPENLNQNTFIASAIKYCSSTPKLLQADRTSLYHAIFDAAAAGVKLDGREGFINIFSGRCQFQTMYKGNAKRAGFKKYGAFLVHAGDIFENYMTENGAEFKYSMTRKDRGELELAVAWSVDEDDFKRILTVPAERINQVVKKFNKNSTWNTDRDEMIKKHVINVMTKHVVEPAQAPSMEIVDNETGEIKEVDITPPKDEKDENLTPAEQAILELGE